MVWGWGACSGLPRRCAPRNDRVLEEVGVEVAPGGVGGFDEGEFAGAGAGFESFFAGDGGGHGGVLFVISWRFGGCGVGGCGGGGLR